MHFDLKLADAAATAALGKRLAAGVAPGRVMHLQGDLGTGKTTLVRGLLRALGVQGAVKSPTYTWVEPYTVSRLDLYHFDFYRFTNETEWLSSGLRDYFRPDSVCIVEWPERVGALLPPPDVRVVLSHEGEARTASLSAHSPAGEAWLSSSSFS